MPVARVAPLPCMADREACAASVASRSSFASSGRSKLRSVTCHACAWLEHERRFGGIGWQQRTRTNTYAVCYKA